MYAIQSVLSGVRSPTPSPNLNENLTQIITIVSSIVAVCKDNLPPGAQAQGEEILRELLRLYVPSSSSVAARQLEGLLSVQAHPVVRRIPGAGPIAAGRGLEITLTVDEAPFGGGGGVLLAAVLDRFFAKYVSINAFTETVLRSPDRGEVARWPLRLGQRPVV